MTEKPISEQMSSPFGEISYVFQGANNKKYVQTYPLFAPHNSGPTASIRPTYLRTIYNQPIHLKILPGKSSIGQGTRPGPNGNPETYFVPKGTFQLIVPDDVVGSPPYYLLCGLAGTEFLAFYSGDLITFYPGNPAYAPRFPLAQNDNEVTSHSQLLTDDYTTAWVSITPGVNAPGLTAPGMTAIRYYAQPQQASLFRPAHGFTASGSTGLDQLNMLNTFHTPAALIGPTAAADAPSYPLVPYAGAAPLPDLAQEDATQPFTWSEITEFEQQILNPQRRQTISEKYEGPVGATPNLTKAQREVLVNPASGVTAVTPQGLLAVVSPDLPNWYSLTLANSVWDKGPTGEYPPVAYAATAAGLNIRQVDYHLQDALQSNQLFLVISQTEAHVKGSPSDSPKIPILGDFNTGIGIDNWVFETKTQNNNNLPEDSQNLSNVMIFKFRPGKLIDMVKHLGYWTKPDIFNADAGNTQLWIQDYLDETYHLSKLPGNEDYHDIVTLMENPDWTGILILKVDLNLQEFPQQLRGLLAGINLSRFNAHHIGINLNQLQVNNKSEVYIPKSSLFGLISYIAQDSDSASSTTSTGNSSEARYAFEVLTLKILFRNSKIKDFHSRILLTTNSWFNTPATLETDSNSNTLPQHTIEMDGHYENHNGEDVYSFVTKAGQYYTFYLDNDVVRYVEIVKAQFHTTSSQFKSATDQHIGAAFSLWGYLNFYALPGFDIFSFGSDADAVYTGEGLYFANLAIDMDFDLDTGSGSPKVTGRKFTFNADQATFDMSLSTARKGSIFSRFPMTIHSLQVSDPNQPPNATKTPKDLGFVRVELPDNFKGAGLTNIWYGLHCQLQMGSLGALASDAGFTGEMLLAWSPVKDAPSAFIGLKMPGDKHKGFTLQDILKVSIKDFVLLEQTVKKGTPANYTLKFDHMGLKLLGVSLPPGAEIDLYLFGGETATTGSLGWYGAYIKKKKKKPGKKSQTKGGGG